MKEKPVKKPKPIVTAQVCDICGEDWAKHPEEPTVLDCIELLRARPTASQWQHFQSVIPPYNYCSTTTAGSYVVDSAASNVTRLNVGAAAEHDRNIELDIGNIDDDDDGEAGARVPA